MKKQLYHRLTILFFTLAILLLVVIGFLMCYSDGVFTLGSFRLVLIEQKQEPIVHPSSSQVELPELPLDIIYHNPNGVSNRVKHWDEETHTYTDSDNIQYIYSISTSTIPSIPSATENTNIYVVPMGHQEQVILRTDTYDSVIQTIEQAIYHHVQTYHVMVTYSITYEYKNKDDVRPMYLRLELYSPQDKGTTINWNILLYNDR